VSKNNTQQRRRGQREREKIFLGGTQIGEKHREKEKNPI